MSAICTAENELSRLKVIQEDFCAALGPEYQQEVADVLFEVNGQADVDTQLQAITGALRSRFLQSMAARTSIEWRTPLTGKSRTFPGHTSSFRHAYDRSHPAEALSERVQFGEQGSRNRLTGATVCSSGMAAINVAVQSLAYVLRRGDLKLGAYASYFETHTLFRTSSVAGRWKWIRSETELLESISTATFNVLFLETIQWDWTLAALDWHKVIDALNRTVTPPIVILDTSLTGSSRQTLECINLLLESAAPIVIRLRSCLKLDQEGFELGNLGALTWGIRRDAAVDHLRLPIVIDSFRVVSGAGVGWHEACSLSPRFVANESSCGNYAERVLESNRNIYHRVPVTGAMFRQPSFPAPPWSAPFVLYILSREDENCYQRLAELIHREVKRRAISIAMSGSFGFRQTRYETFVIDEQKRAGEKSGGALKVAAGAYEGLANLKMSDLLEELFSFNSLYDAEHHFGRTTFGRA